MTDLETNPPVADQPNANAERGQTQDVIPRDKPQPDERRRSLVSHWNTVVKQAKAHFYSEFQRMRDDQNFCYGHQWAYSTDRDERYVANITLRHVNQRVAQLYARNPTAVAKVRDRILNTVWDGTQQQLMQSQQNIMAFQEALSLGLPAQPPNPMDMMIIQDAMQVMEVRRQLDRVAQTLEILFEYNVSEQAHPFKTMMKLLVRRALTTGVGYVKVGFQRAMQSDPDVEARIADVTTKLDTLERLVADLADDELDEETDYRMEQLRLMMQDLQEQQEIIVREGLTFAFPYSQSIIPDPNTKVLRNFVGADWVAEEYYLSPDQIKEIYEVDVGSAYQAYRPKTGNTNERGDREVFVPVRSTHQDQPQSGQATGYPHTKAVVWEIWHRKDGLVYVVCDGYPDFLREPAAPDVWTERFWPWYNLVLNECDNPNELFPPSDVRLLRPMQKDYNRARQGLREHRHANRPKTIVAGGVLSEEDTEKLKNHPNNAVIELQGMAPGSAVDQLLQAYKGPPIDPGLYETRHTFDDVQRTVGTQEANLGGTSGDTATESSIAESSRVSSLSSNIDELNELLTGVAHTSGQILILNVEEETVKSIVGPGAIWPDLTREQVAQDVLLEIEAGSTGRPNQAQEIQNAERVMPLLFQIPGISPEFLARELLRRLDDQLDLSKAFDQALPSVVSANNMLRPDRTGSAAGVASQGGSQGNQQAQLPPSQTSNQGPPAQGSAPDTGQGAVQ